MNNFKTWCRSEESERKKKAALVVAKVLSICDSLSLGLAQNQAIIIQYILKRSNIVGKIVVFCL